MVADGGGIPPFLRQLAFPLPSSTVEATFGAHSRRGRSREINEDHYQSIKNLGANDADNRTADDRFINLRAFYLALLVQASWIFGTYWLAWFALRKRERS